MPFGTGFLLGWHLPDPLLEPRLLLPLLVTFVATYGKVVGAHAGARLVGGRDHRTAPSLGAGTNARGAMEIIVGTIGPRLGVLSQATPYIIVIMAMATALMAPPALRWALRHIRLGSESSTGCGRAAGGRQRPRRQPARVDPGPREGGGRRERAQRGGRQRDHGGGTRGRPERRRC